MTKTIPQPKYRRKRVRSIEYATATFRDVVTGKKRQVCLGRWNSPDSRAKYRRELAAYDLSGGRITVATAADQVTVAQLLHACQHDPSAHGSLWRRASVTMIGNILLAFYPNALATELGPNALRLVRDQLAAGKIVAPGQKRPLGRKSINRLMRLIVAIYKWGVSHELVAESAYARLGTLEPLRPGSCTIADPAPVRPAPDSSIDAAIKRATPQVAAMIQLQRLTGMRPGEVTIMRAADIDTTGGVWTYRPATHKTAYRGFEREVFPGKRAQAIIAPWLASNPTGYLFSAAEVVALKRAERRARRVTADSCGNTPGSNCVKTPRKVAGDRYTTGSYRKAIASACDAAAVDTFTPHELRHSFGTIVRKSHGLEAASILLGHADANITKLYAEADHSKSVAIAAEIG